MKEWRRWTSFASHTVGAVAAFLVLLQRALIEAKVGRANHDWWAHPRLQFAGVILVGAVALGDGVLGAYRQVVGPAKERAQQDRRQALLSALVTINKIAPDVDLTELGLNAFMVRRDGWRRDEILQRVERYRLSDSPHPSKVRFTRGKGIIGTCWANQRPEYINWQPIAERYSGRALTDQEFADIREVTRAGFTRADFLSLVGKYAEIHAVPIVAEDGELLGVLALDREARDPLDGQQLIKSHQIRVVLTEAAKVVASVLPGK